MRKADVAQTLHFLQGLRLLLDVADGDRTGRPHANSGRHYYFRPRERATGKELALTPATIVRHLRGELTIGLYAINPRTQRSKWIVIDADYEHALDDLIKLQWELKQDGIEAALEKSRRGGHLWIFGAAPLRARDCRVYVYNLADRLKMAVKGGCLPEGIEVFPRHNTLKPGEFGNAIRGPLGVHRTDKKRYWFYGADYTLEAQIRYLKALRKLSEDRLRLFGRRHDDSRTVSRAHSSAEPSSRGSCTP